MLASFRQDLRYGVRQLRTAPGFTLIAALTLALGIGANTVMFGIVDGMLFRPPAEVVDPSTLVRLELQLPALPGDGPQLSGVVSYPDYVAVRDGARALSGVAAQALTSLTVGRAEERSEPAVLASGDYFSLLGTRAALGRLLTEADDQEGAPAPVAVLAWTYFQRAYSGDPRVLGQSIVLNGRAFTIIGVAPKRFVGTQGGSPSIWVPLSAAPQLGYDAQMVRSRFASWLTVVARLARGASREQAQASVQAALLAVRDAAGSPLPTGLGPGGALPSSGEVRVQIGAPDNAARSAPPPPRARLTVVGGLGGNVRGRGNGDGPALPVSLWFLAVTGAVLLIACANVANLLLVRAASRAHEIAVRLSIGATRDRLTRQLLTESLLLAVLGGAAAVLVANAGAALLPRVLPMPPIADVVDRRALLFTVLLTVGTTLAFGLAPALRATRQDLNVILGAAGRSRAGRSLGRDALVVVQLGISLALLVAAGLFVRSLRNVKAVNTGFAVERILLASADVRGGAFTREQSEEYWRRARERVAALPGVRAVSLGVAMPFEMNINLGVTIPAAPSADGRPRPVSADFASPEYFATLGIPVLQGRAFTTEDVETSAPVVIVNQAFVRRYLRAVNPLTACIQTGRPGGSAPACAPIVGVVADARFTGVTRDPEPFMFRPITQRPRQMPAATMMHVRTDGDPTAVLGSVRRELQAVDARVSFATVRPMAALIEPELAPWRVGTFVFTLFGALGALLAAVGLYGVVSFVVAQRTRELGVRMALGARSGDVLTLVLAYGARLVLVGIAAGAVVAALSTRLFASLMFGVSPFDPIVFAAMAALLGLVALAAAYVPAWRATHVDPMHALRAE